MKAIAVAALAVALCAPRAAWAQRVQVSTDAQGVQTYTVGSPAREAQRIKVITDAQGVQTYTNGPASRRASAPSTALPQDDEHSAASPRQDRPELPAATDVAPREPPSAPNPSAPYNDSSGSDGQWVYTQQYGWVWMPYGAKYVSEGSAGDDTPYAYVYDPTNGWGWLEAPWVWGWGPYPSFGTLGPGRFGWYRGLRRAGYGWGEYRGGGPGRVGFARSRSAPRRGAQGGPSFSGGYGARASGGGARFHTGGGLRSAAAPRASFGGSGFSGGRSAGFSGGRGGGGGHAGGHR